MLVDKGFSVGMVVHRKADGLEGTIFSMSGMNVHLRFSDGSEKSATADSFLAGEWKQVKVKAPAQDFEDWKEKGITKDLFLSAIKGRILGAFYNRDLQNSHLDQLQLTLKPRGVRVLEKFKSGTLKLPLITTKVELTTTEKCGQASVCMGKASKDRYIDGMVWM
eukprot:Skav200674  [mRNA]  locus=scaffold6592:1:492:+ [translate_table: standard]